ncbi:MAG: dTDP-4-dehydrorhamnose 3,5-epimerase [Candidatus Omnitrophica bacterium]|nr:dTDP-4-dehydrorhamnose 3,5-epimerase [Candidatus Omnitrophota bacterium]
MPFIFKKLEIPEVILVEPEIFGDSRGFFVELYKKTDFSKQGIDAPIAQVSYSRSTKNVLRGLHYQKNPFAQSKLVRAVKGEIFDVAVDIRKGSPTFGQWVAAYLDSKKMNMLYIPEGFAHGFLTLSTEAEVEYCCSKEYCPESEAGIIYNDPAINIAWPEASPKLSNKDLTYPYFEEAENNFVFEK